MAARESKGSGIVYAVGAGAPTRRMNDINFAADLTAAQRAVGYYNGPAVNLLGAGADAAAVGLAAGQGSQIQLLMSEIKADSYTPYIHKLKQAEARIKPEDVIMRHLAEEKKAADAAIIAQNTFVTAALGRGEPIAAVRARAQMIGKALRIPSLIEMDMAIPGDTLQTAWATLGLPMGDLRGQQPAEEAPRPARSEAAAVLGHAGGKRRGKRRGGRRA